MSLDAYRRTAAQAASPRATEHRLLSDITRELGAARDARLSGAALMASLHRNREAWSLFGTLCADANNALPQPLRAGIMSLALWVDRHTSEVMAGRGEIDDLIAVNREIIAGLETPPLAQAA